MAVALAGLSQRSAALASGPVTERLLYVTNNPARLVDIYDIADQHRYLRSFPMDGEKVGGVCADAASSRLFITQQDENTVTAYELVSGKRLWQVHTLETYGYGQPDRLSITTNGKALYVPMKRADKTLILDTASGERFTEFDRPGRPHNSFAGERGKYMYVAGRSDPVMYVVAQDTHKVVKKIGPFSWPIRPFSVDPTETWLYANLTYKHGFGVANIETGQMHEVEHLPPRERTRHWDQAKAGLPHGDGPYSHGIAVRPYADEVWYLDDQWGYLYVFDTAEDPSRPRFKRQVELFEKIDQPWAANTGNRWVAFSVDGRYCYPSDGLVVDAEAGRKTDMRIAPSEKLIEVQFSGDEVVRVGGQMGGVYA